MIYDVTGKNSGENFPYSDGCVLIFRAGGGNVTVNFDPGISRGEAARALSTLAEGLCAAEIPDETAEKISEETAPGSAANFSAENATDAPAKKPAAGEKLPDGPEADVARKGANPEDVTEDFVRWRDGYTAYRQDGSWWWVRWHDAESESWGMSGPLMSAVAVKKGPFDNFDETLASMMRHRAEIFHQNSYIG